MGDHHHGGLHLLEGLQRGEQALLATLETLKEMKTTVVVIAHRPSILAGMDKMLVLGPGGAVGAYGPAQEVMGRFAAASEGAPAASQIAKVDS